MNDRTTMNLIVHLFAGARELAGAADIAIELTPGTTVADLRQALSAQHPNLAPLAARSLVAANGQYAPDATPIGPADELALIPPVSGG